jgi:uncharacterized protein YaiE (UPF0345 family)
MNGWIVSAALFALNWAPAGQASSAVTDPWKALEFLEGTWEARVQAGSAGAQANGTYTFNKELKRHVLARHSDSAGCKGPKDFDCEHTDLLYVYQEADGQPLKAIYFDSEGHVIHYAVSTPESTAVVFISEASPSGPQFRLAYQLRGAVMSGKFQMRMPGQDEWKSYLEWHGSRR